MANFFRQHLPCPKLCYLALKLPTSQWVLKKGCQLVSAENLLLGFEKPMRSGHCQDCLGLAENIIFHKHRAQTIPPSALSSPPMRLVEEIAQGLNQPGHEARTVVANSGNNS